MDGGGGSRALQQRFFLALQRRRRSPSCRDARCLHAKLVVNGFSDKRFLLAKLLSLYIAAGDLPSAVAAAGDCPSTTLSNLLLRAQPTLSHSILLFSRLRKAPLHPLRPNGFSFSILLAACAKAGAKAAGKQLHALSVASGFYLCAHVQTCLVCSYDIGDAQKVFDEMRIKNVVAWNSLLAAYVKIPDMPGAEKLFTQMPKKDAVSWTTMIAAHVSTGNTATAMQFFNAMRRARVSCDQVTLVALLSAAAKLRDSKIGRWARQRVEFLKQQGVRRLVSLDNALVHMYIECGDIAEARCVFSDMKTRDSSSWTTMISGLARHNLFEEAMELFHAMTEAPDSATLLAVLSACSYSGRLDDGRRILQSMESDYGIKPEVQHYGCIVDMLCRGNHLAEAYEVIRAMPEPANDAVWGALLSGCQRHGDVKFARRIVSRILELRPEKASGYLAQLSRMYAEVGKWNEAEKARRRIGDKFTGMSSSEGNPAT